MAYPSSIHVQRTVCRTTLDTAAPRTPRLSAHAACMEWRPASGYARQKLRAYDPPPTLRGRKGDWLATQLL